MTMCEFDIPCDHLFIRHVSHDASHDHDSAHASVSCPTQKIIPKSHWIPKHRQRASDQSHVRKSLPSSNDLPRFLGTGRGRLRYEERLPRCFQCPAPNLSKVSPHWSVVKKSFTRLSNCRNSFLLKKEEGHLLPKSPCSGSNFRGAGGVVHHADLRG